MNAAAALLPTSVILTMTQHMNQKGHRKPTRDQVLEYADDQTRLYLHKHGSDLPPEQRDEVIQAARVRVLDAYERLDESKGWKSFIQWHCCGAVLDYIRDGRGFEESGWEKKPPEGDEPEVPTPTRTPALRYRVESVGGDDGDAGVVNVEEIAGIFGVFTEDLDSSRIKPRWDLVARMARQDEDIHLVAKVLLGYSQTELSEDFGVSRERLHQRIREFFDRLDSPALISSPWIEQTIHAFGMGELFHMDTRDNGLGWNFEPVDLFATNSVREARPQLCLFEGGLQ